MAVKDFLQGKWLHHPLHPALVHVPTGLWPAALVFDVCSYCFSDPLLDRWLARTAFWCILVGLIGAVAAVPAGLADWWDIKPDRPARKIGLWHLAINGLVAVLFAANLGVRLYQGVDATPPRPTAATLTGLGVGLLFISGYLGGRMVYDHGIGVARQSKRRWRRVAEAAGANVPEE